MARDRNIEELLYNSGNRSFICKSYIKGDDNAVCGDCVSGSIGLLHSTVANGERLSCP